MIDASMKCFVQKNKINFNIAKESVVIDGAYLFFLNTFSRYSPRDNIVDRNSEHRYVRCKYVYMRFSPYLSVFRYFSLAEFTGGKITISSHTYEKSSEVSCV